MSATRLLIGLGEATLLIVFACASALCSLWCLQTAARLLSHLSLAQL